MARFMFVRPAHGNDYDLAELPSWQGCRTAPIGLLNILSYLDSKGHQTRLVDGRELIVSHRSKDMNALLAREVEHFRPDFIAFQLMTAWFDEVAFLAQYCRENYPHIKLIAGGPHTTVEPGLTLAQIPDLDAVCVGPAEETCLEIAQGDRLEEITGLMTRGAEAEFTKRKKQEPVDKYPIPYQGLDNLDFYTGYSAYSAHNFLCKSLALLTARGCPNGCRFCASHVSGPHLKLSLGYVYEMIRYLAGFDIDTICFYDDTLAQDRERLELLCAFMKDTGLFVPKGRLRWHALMRADQAEPAILKSMKEAGCVLVVIGMESGCDRVLDLISKGASLELNRQAARYIAESGMLLGAPFIIGIPGETEDEMLQTLAFMEEMSEHTLGLCSFRPMPGSPFYYRLIAQGALVREEIDWARLGDLSSLPEQSFAEVSLERLQELTRRGQEIAYGRQYVSVHQDIKQREPKLVRAVRRRVACKVLPAPFETPRPSLWSRLGNRMRLQA